MTGEINKLAGNTLAAGESVHLPQIGTLKIVRRKAARLSSRSIAPPHRTVVFDAEAEGVSLVALIAGAAGIGEEQAQSAYESWKSKTYAGGVLTMPGVGTLRDGRFTVTGEFDAFLNPHGTEPLALTPLINTSLYAFCAACCIVAIAIGAYIWYDDCRTDAATKMRKQTPKVVAEAPVPVDTASEDVAEQTTETTTAETETETETELAATKVADADGMMPQSLVSGRSYVVSGVYGVEENARKNVEQARLSSGPECKIYRFGGKFMVSPFESDNRAECNDYLRTFAGRRDDMWVYTAK